MLENYHNIEAVFPLLLGLKVFATAGWCRNKVSVLCKS